MKENNTKVYQKLWFWVCIVLVIFIIWILINWGKINLLNLEKELQEYHQDITVYQSISQKDIIIDCNFENENDEQDKEYKIGEIVGSNLSNFKEYENIQIRLNVKNKYKAIFNINPKTQEVDNTIQHWYFEGEISGNTAGKEEDLFERAEKANEEWKKSQQEQINYESVYEKYLNNDEEESGH